MKRNKPVSQHQFAMVPSPEVERSSYLMEHMHKTTIDCGLIIPLYVDEMLPGDTFNMRCQIVGRLATPLFPVMDNLTLNWWFFAVPIRLVWDNFVKMMGEQTNPGDSTDFIVPQIVITGGGVAELSIFDYLGWPLAGQLSGNKSVNVLPLRCYNLIMNEWFRDENLMNSLVVDRDDGPDDLANYSLFARCKQPDYFTTCLPFLQKGPAVGFSLAGSAQVVSNGTAPLWRAAFGTEDHSLAFTASDQHAYWDVPIPPTETGFAVWGAETGLEADMTTVTAGTVNALRLAAQMQMFLERDARGGTRYVETVLSHFRVRSPDARLQRPEYIGGGRSMVNVAPIAQTSATSATGSDTPQGNLAAIRTAFGSGGFTYSATEHCYVFGLCCVTADLTYQNGIRKMWLRRTRVDFAWPLFAHLGEQAVTNAEIFANGDGIGDEIVFGYQERYGEYRYFPSMITGKFRSNAAATLDPWHYAENFGSAPLLNAAFMRDPTQAVMERSQAVSDEPSVLIDAAFRCRAARPLPLYGVPQLGGRF